MRAHAATTDQRRKELAQIHIAVHALGWTDADYRAILLAKTGKHSAADLDVTQRRNFIAHLQASGWKQGPRREFTQTEKITYLWQQLAKAGALRDTSPAALMAFIGRTAGLTVASLQFLPPSAASKAIEGLKAMLKRLPAQ